MYQAHTFKADDDYGGIGENAPKDASTALAVRHALRARALRSRHLPAHFFSDPAWDLLLELFSAELEQRRMPINALGLQSGIPPTTALRWLNALVQADLAYRRNDPFDARRVYMSLSSSGWRAMRDYFKESAQ